MPSVDLIIIGSVVLVAAAFSARAAFLYVKGQKHNRRQVEIVRALDDIGYRAGRIGRAPNFREKELGIPLSASEQFIILTGWKRGWKELQDNDRSNGRDRAGKREGVVEAFRSREAYPRSLFQSLVANDHDADATSRGKPEP